MSALNFCPYCADLTKGRACRAHIDLTALDPGFPPISAYYDETEPAEDFPQEALLDRLPQRRSLDHV